LKTVQTKSVHIAIVVVMNRYLTTATDVRLISALAAARGVVVPICVALAVNWNNIELFDGK